MLYNYVRFKINAAPDGLVAEEFFMLKILYVLLFLIGISFAVIYYQNSNEPLLGVNDGRFMPLGTRPNAVSTQAKDADKKVATWTMKNTPEQTTQAILYSIESYGGAEIIENNNNYVYVVFTTPLMKYHDDVEFWIDESAGEVHFRSSSRAGYSDRGLNRQRYDALALSYAGAN